MLSVEEQRALALKEREEKQRKYEERRLELFGAPAGGAGQKQNSSTSSPGGTPPGSRSSTPSRGRGGRGGGRKGEQVRPVSSTPSGLALRQSGVQATAASREKELYDPDYTKKPESGNGVRGFERRENVVEPIRAPRGPDGSGRGGFGFAPRGGKTGT